MHENVFFPAGIVACNWLVIFSVCFTMMCTFDPTGRTFVKLKATRRRQRNLTTYTLRYTSRHLPFFLVFHQNHQPSRYERLVSSFRHRLEEGQASSWSRRLKFFMCCTRAQDTQSVRHNNKHKHVIRVFHTRYSQCELFFLRTLIRRWPAYSPSSSGIWTLCRVTSSLVWCSCDRDREPKDQPSWIRYKPRREP